MIDRQWLDTVLDRVDEQGLQLTQGGRISAGAGQRRSLSAAFMAEEVGQFGLESRAVAR